MGQPPSPAYHPKGKVSADLKHAFPRQVSFSIVGKHLFTISATSASFLVSFTSPCLKCVIILLAPGI